LASEVLINPLDCYDLEDEEVTIFLNEIRHGFIRKCYLLLSCACIFTLAYASYFVLDVERAQQFYRCSPALVIALVVTIMSFSNLICFQKDKRWPWNYLFLFAFVWSTGHLLTYIACRNCAEDI